MNENLNWVELLTLYMKHLFSRAYNLYNDEIKEEDNKEHLYHVKRLIEQYETTQALNANNLIIIKGFGSLLWAWYTNDSYKKRIKKEDTLPLFFQHYAPWTVVYFNSLTTTLRSKKNRRPIFLNHAKLTWGFISWLLWACKNFLSPSIPMNQRRAWLTKYIMSCVFVGKDEELVEQEKMLTNIYKFYKNPLFCVEIKDFWDSKTMFNALASTFLTEEVITILKNNQTIKKEITSILQKKAETMRNVNLFFDSYEEAEECVNFFQKYWKDVSLLWRETYTKIFEHYLKGYVFYEEHMLSWIKSNNLWLTELYKWNAFDTYQKNMLEEDCLNLELIKMIAQKSPKEVKALYKRIYEWFDFSYKETVFNSFLTQPDLSNSLELCQDVYQEFLRDLGISFDDMYINKIEASMLREPKNVKKDTLFKNINWVWLHKKLSK